MWNQLARQRVGCAAGLMGNHTDCNTTGNDRSFVRCCTGLAGHEK